MNRLFKLADAEFKLSYILVSFINRPKEPCPLFILSIVACKPPIALLALSNVPLMLELARSVLNLSKFADMPLRLAVLIFKLPDAASALAIILLIWLLCAPTMASIFLVVLSSVCSEFAILAKLLSTLAWKRGFIILLIEP